MSIYFYSVVQTILIIIYLTGYWEFFGLKLRNYYFILIEFLLLLLIANWLHSPSTNSFNWAIVAAFISVELFLIYELVKILVVILKKEKYSLEITFPINAGRFLITDGGNSKVSRLMNYHFHSKVHKRKGTNYSMKFATDIVRIDPPLSTFLPTENKEYPIFENLVHSPIGGIVFKVINDIDDNIPYSGNYPYNTGNTIVIRDRNLFLLIGHLKKESITKKEGDKVLNGEIVAMVGNSGYTERPHIHMQLIKSDSDDYWFGMGVNMTYLGKNLYKNRIIYQGHIALHGPLGLCLFSNVF
jgi:hypothetical protein